MGNLSSKVRDLEHVIGMLGPIIWFIYRHRGNINTGVSGNRIVLHQYLILPHRQTTHPFPSPCSSRKYFQGFLLAYYNCYIVPTFITGCLMPAPPYFWVPFVLSLTLEVSRTLS